MGFGIWGLGFGDEDGVVWCLDGGVEEWRGGGVEEGDRVGI